MEFVGIENPKETKKTKEKIGYTLTIEKSIYERFKRFCEENGLSFKSLVLIALREYIAKFEKKHEQ